MFAWTERAPYRLFETRDAWATWTPASMDGLQPGRTVDALAIDPLRPERMYASTSTSPSDPNQTNIYRKIGAAPWERLAVPPYDCFNGSCGSGVAGIWISPALEAGQTFATVWAGPVVSRDGGATWLRHFQGNLGTVVFDRQNPLNMWAANNAANFVRSVNGGISWQGTSFFASPVLDAVVQDAADPQTLYSAYRDVGMFTSINAGTAWSSVLAPGISLPAIRLEDIAFDPVDPGTAYLVANQGGVFKTTNGAGAWDGRNAGVLDPFAQQAISRIAVDRFNRNNVFMGGFGGVWKSPDGAANWTQISDAQFLGVDTRAPDTVFTTYEPSFDAGQDPNCFGTPGTPSWDCYYPMDYQRIHNGVSTGGTLWSGTTASKERRSTPSTCSSYPTSAGASCCRSSPAPATPPRRERCCSRSRPRGSGQTLMTGYDVGRFTSYVFFDASGGRNDMFAGGSSGAAPASPSRPAPEARRGNRSTPRRWWISPTASRASSRTSRDCSSIRRRAAR